MYVSGESARSIGTLVHTVAGVCVAIVGFAASAGAQSASWLDASAPTGWNVANADVPAAPAMPAGDARCRATARPAQVDADKRVQDRGWQLVGAFQGGWQVIVVRGAAGHDGMCRPLQYQDFVFVDGAFAGTLSPAPMDSRTDGALSGVSLSSGTRLTAEYTRYTSSDALCCPSRITRVVFEIPKSGPVRPVSADTQSTTAASAASPGLAGTSWQLVAFKGADGTTSAPDDRAKYTIAFEADGRVAARVDCNRGRGTWKVSGTDTLALGPLALTRAMCPPDSLHDKVVSQWGSVRSFAIRDGHLFLTLASDGGTFEYEPVTGSSPR